MLLSSYGWFTDDFWHSLACSCNTSICLCCHIFSSSCKDTSHIRLRTQSFLVAQRVKNLPAMQESQVRSLGQDTPVFLPGEFHGQRSLVSYSPWGCKESDTTERLTLPLSDLLLADYVCSDFPNKFTHIEK